MPDLEVTDGFCEIDTSRGALVAGSDDAITAVSPVCSDSPRPAVSVGSGVTFGATLGGSGRTGSTVTLERFSAISETTGWGSRINEDGSRSTIVGFSIEGVTR